MSTKAKQQSSQQMTRGFEPYQETKGEEYMSERMRAHFTAILNKWKQELMEEVDRTVHHMQDEAANFPDPADRASQEEEFSLELRARDRERKLIKKIDETLQLIEDEEYGWCDSCGVEIGIRRLGGAPHRDPLHRLQDPRGNPREATRLLTPDRAGAKRPVSFPPFPAAPLAP